MPERYSVRPGAPPVFVGGAEDEVMVRNLGPSAVSYGLWSDRAGYQELGSIAADATATTAAGMWFWVGDGQRAEIAAATVAPSSSDVSDALNVKLDKPAGGADGQVLTYRQDGTVAWQSPSTPAVREIVELGNLSGAEAFSMSGRTADVVLTGKLVGNVTFVATGMTLGSRIRLMLAQDGTGGRTFTVGDGTATAAVTLSNTAADTTFWVDLSHNGLALQVAPVQYVTGVGGVAALSNLIDSMFPNGTWLTATLPNNTLTHATSEAGARELLVELGGKGPCSITYNSATVGVVGTPTTPFVVGQRVLGDGVQANSRIAGPGARGDIIAGSTFTLDRAAVGTKTTTLAGPTPWVNTSSYTARVYVVPANTPYVPVDLVGSFANESWARGLKQMLANGVPIPDGLSPTNDSDATIVLLQPDWESAGGTLTGRIYELWAVKRPDQNASGRWSCRWGWRLTGSHQRTNGGRPINRTTNSNATTLPTDPNYAVEGTAEEASWGVMATKLPFSHQVIRLDELARREVRHPIGFMCDTYYPAPGHTAMPVWPASGADTSSRPNLRQGARFRLPSSYTVSTDRHWIWQMIVTAMRDHGLVFDDTAANLAIRSEPGSLSYFNGYPGGIEQLMRELPWGDLEQIEVGSDGFQNPVPVAPSNSVAPAITGPAITGFTLTSSTGTWAGAPTPTYTYQWKRNDAAITGATASAYVLQVADEAQTVACTVTATNASGSASATSASVTPAAPVASGFVDQTAASGTPSGASFSAPKPTAAVAGDLLILRVRLFPSTATIAAPAGWTQLGTTATNSSGSTFTEKLFYRTYDNSSSQAVGFSGSATFYSTASFAWRGIDLANPVGGYANSGVSTTTTWTAPTLTAAAGNGWHVVQIFNESSFTISSGPATYTQRGAAVFEKQVAAGATGAQTVTLTGSARGGAHSILLNPA